MISANAISLQSPPVAVSTQARPTAGRGEEAGGEAPVPAAEARSAQAAPPSSGSPFRGVNLDITA
jgi:hypothetical protein